MILLLEPRRPPGFVSGGYRYQAEIGERLAARGEGELRAIAPHELDGAVAAAEGPVVVDSLFAASRPTPLPAGAVVLLHGRPARAAWCAPGTAVIATSQRTADAVAAEVRAVEVVRPGLDACFAPGAGRAADGRLRIVCVGTVGAAKGQRQLAAAVAASAAADRCDLVLLGDTAIEPDTVRAVAAAIAPARLRLAGVLPPAEVAGELRGADLFVSASRDESFGMAAAEAAAVGVPVLAFDTGEIGSFVRDGDNGWLVPPDAPDAAFAHCLAAKLADPAALARARQRARRPALADWDEVARQFATACRRLGR